MLPCPYCDSEAFLDYSGEAEYVGRCCKCDAISEPSTNCCKETAKGLWNKFVEDINKQLEI
jgi:hypothetical protein